VVHGDNIWAAADLKKDPKKGAPLPTLKQDPPANTFAVTAQARTTFLPTS